MLACACLIAVPGCIKLDNTVTIKKNGAGTIREVVVLDTEKLDELEKLVESMGGGDSEFEFESGSNATREEKLARFEHIEGVRLVSSTYEEDKENHKTTAKVELEFDSLEACYRAGLEDDTDVSLEKIEDGAWLLTKKLAREGMPADDGDGEEDPSTKAAKAAKALFGPIMKDLEMKWSLTVPGPIITTNGTKSETGNTVTWTMSFDDFFDVTKHTMTVKFKGEGLTLKPFKLTAAQIKKSVEEADEKVRAAKEKEEAEKEKAGAGGKGG